MKRLVMLFSVFCLMAAALFADGGAERPINSDEKAFYEATYRKIIDLLPDAQNGIAKKPEELSIPKMVGVGYEKFPIQMYVSCSYRGEMSMQQSMEAGALLAKDAEGLESMSEQLNSLSEEMQKAAEAGDQPKMLELQAKMQAAVLGNSSMKNMQQMTSDLEAKSLSVEAAINANGADFHPYQVIPTPAGASLAIRREKSKDVKSQTVLFFGPYTNKPYKETMAVYVERKPATANKVHHFYLSVTGEPETCAAYIAKMNLTSLAALIK
ncbi:MAG: hypothetical protein CVV42_17430 [Candidatus Riflebacteria bacterium HGW-Riflebacteria-2]|jgi:hypothetical protein|nr:MAG: hypothetical protein CVV42_17430 [Candidatus Riflebacteria bacterium HGW-Riflebacteria-2]